MISKPKDGLSSENLRELIKSLEQKKRRHHPYHQKWQKNYLTFWPQDSNSHLLTAWFITHCPKKFHLCQKILKNSKFLDGLGFITPNMFGNWIASYWFDRYSSSDLHWQKLRRFPIVFLLNFNFWFLDSKWMKYVLAFGAGTLLGDAFLHLLPEAMNYPNWGYG